MENQIKKKEYIFHVHGMHCHSCTLVIENEIKKMSCIDKSNVNLKKNIVSIVGDFGNKTEQQIADELNPLIKPHGYTLAFEKQIEGKKWSDFKIAIPIALLFLVIFVFLQKIGIVNLIDTSKISYGTSFVIGIIASLSTCMAVVGGLLLSLSATFAKENNSENNLIKTGSFKIKNIKPQMMFHGGRIVSFFVLGGVIGTLGSIFTLNSSATFILGLFIGLVMLIMGINLLEIFSFSKKAAIHMPKFISQRAFNISKLNHTLTPLLVGIATFFLPCGFTQSMQIYTLSTGNFLEGALTMFFFALGTLPILLLISFSSFSIKNNKNSGIFFKTAGLIIISFALINIINSLVIIGLIPPVFNF